MATDETNAGSKVHIATGEGDDEESGRTAAGESNTDETLIKVVEEESIPYQYVVECLELLRKLEMRL